MHHRYVLWYCKQRLPCTGNRSAGVYCLTLTFLSGILPIIDHDKNREVVAEVHRKRTDKIFHLFTKPEGFTLSVSNVNFDFGNLAIFLCSFLRILKLPIFKKALLFLFKRVMSVKFNLTEDMQKVFEPFYFSPYVK